METEQWESSGAHTLLTLGGLHPPQSAGPILSPQENCGLDQTPPSLSKAGPTLTKPHIQAATLRPYYQLLSEGPTLPDLAPPSFPTSLAPKVLSSRVLCKVRMSGVRYCRLTTVT